MVDRRRLHELQDSLPEAALNVAQGALEHWQRWPPQEPPQARAMREAQREKMRRAMRPGTIGGGSGGGGYNLGRGALALVRRGSKRREDVADRDCLRAGGSGGHFLPALAMAAHQVGKMELRSVSRQATGSGKPLHWLLLVLLCGVLFSSCDRHVRVTKEMAWECDPVKIDPRYPDAEPVIFRYPEAPGFFDLASGRGLCQQLQSAGKNTAKVTYEVWGTSRGLHGYRIDLVNGQPLQDIGGPAGSGWQGRGNGGPHPLLRALQ